MNSKEVENEIRKPRLPNPRAIKASDYLSCGSTLVNLAATGNPFGCFVKGKYHFFVGDSASGKTWISLACLAEAARNKNFQHYRLIYDNSEDGALMDFEKFFGAKMAQRVEPPHGTRRKPTFSVTIEDHYFYLDDAINRGEPFIWITDSMDSLSSADEQDKFQDLKKATRLGKTTPGSYGDGKAKKNSMYLRQILPRIEKLESILIILNQTRDNLGFGFEKKVRSGGHALRFYAHLEMWSSLKSKIQRTVQGKNREVGVLSQIQIKKNRFNGRLRKVEIPIYHSYGIDDVGSCVQFLVQENHWKKTKSKIDASEFEVAGSEEKIVRYIEQHNLEKELALLVAEVWEEIEEACTIQRKRKYE